MFSAHPNFLMKPKDQRVGMNGIATFECHASGNPPPSVFWTKEGSQELMFAGTTHGQMFVTEDGTLTIQVNRCTMWHVSFFIQNNGLKNGEVHVFKITK